MTALGKTEKRRTRVAAKLKADNLDTFGPYLGSSINTVLIYLKLSPKDSSGRPGYPYLGELTS